ncbi:MAG TPA: imidazole glycerol phosphate synthase subunit HisH, partial [Puia sp.]|nr:imidazole glycerol phosphate synthase subunit HisH [Puia sp.]
DGLGWIGGKVVAFDKQKMAEQHKVPNMGWLEVKTVKDSKLTTALTDARFYFAHSFHVVVDNPADKLLVAEYGYEFVAAIERDNIIGVQFHPEKSHRFGMQLLKNFVTNF